MKSVFILVVSVITVSVFSQNDSTKLFKPNHFTVSLKDGLNKSKFTPTFGDDKLDERIGHIFQLQFDYTVNFKDQFGLVFRTSFGAVSFTYDLKEKGVYYGTKGWSKFYRDSYNFLGKFSIGGNYHKQLKPKLYLNLNIGTGISINSEAYYSIGSHSTFQTENGNIYLENYDIDYSYSNNFIGYGFLDIGVNYVLKNKNIIGLSLAQELFFKPALSGVYSVYDNTSGGIIENNNNNIALSLNYTFTQYKKYRQNQFMIQTSFLSKKERRKVYKKEKRFVDPNSIFINIGSGLFFGKNIVNDPSNIILNSSFPSWLISANAEVGLKNQYFYEIGVDIAEYWSSIKYTPYGASGSNEFIATKLNFGINKRFISKTSNRNYFNLHAGLGISFHTSEKGLSGWGGGSSQSSQFYFSYTEETRILQNIFPTLYLALEKDLHLTKNLYFSIKYKYDQGFVSASKTDIVYNQDYFNPSYYKATSKINGTAHSVTFGFKYKFLPKK